MKIEKRDVFIANDGKEFFDKAECDKYEKIAGKVKFFKVSINPDLTETGRFVNRIYVAVYADCFHKEIVFNHFIKEREGYLGVSVMGYGFQPKFEIYPCSREEYYKAEPTMWGGRPTKTCQILLSPIEIEGFEERFDYCKEWGFK